MQGEMIFTVLFWTLFLIIGIPLLLMGFSMAMANLAVTINDSLENPELKEQNPEGIGGITVRKMRKHVGELESRGFSVLFGYSVPGTEAYLKRNFIYVLFHPDQKLYAEVFYMQPRLLIVLLALLFDRQNFHLQALNIAFVSAWRDGSRIITTPEKTVVANLLEKDRSQLLPNHDLDALLSAHREALQEKEHEDGEAIVFVEKKDYDRFFHKRTHLAYSTGPQSVEDVLQQED